MNETSKTKGIWTHFEKSLISGKGIDIGCGPDPVSPDARRFDLNDGDANEITKYIHEQFDYVFSSHCLEHMHQPTKTILEWWQLVKPGGHLICIVPDEDLYEQGVWPSVRNSDHKATFTISKRQSWSPVSINVLDLVQTLPGGELIKLELQDMGYNRRFIQTGNTKRNPLFRILAKPRMVKKSVFGKYFLNAYDQTEINNDKNFYQIFFIVRKSDI